MELFHFPFSEKPEEFAAIVREFLSRKIWAVFFAGRAFVFDLTDSGWYKILCKPFFCRKEFYSRRIKGGNHAKNKGYEPVSKNHFHIDAYGYILFHDSWMSSLQMISSWIKNNRQDYSLMETPLQNLILFQKKGTDNRPWDHFEFFYPSQSAMEEKSYRMVYKKLHNNRHDKKNKNFWSWISRTRGS